jgi:hypothetical protein
MGKDSAWKATLVCTDRACGMIPSLRDSKSTPGMQINASYAADAPLFPVRPVQSVQNQQSVQRTLPPAIATNLLQHICLCALALYEH